METSFRPKVMAGQHEPASSKLKYSEEVVVFLICFSYSTLHILMLSDGRAGTRPTSPTAPGTWAKEQKCIFSLQSKA